MKKLFIYYSLTGNGDLVAAEMEKKGYDIRRVELKKDMPKKFFFRIMTGGFLAGIKNRAALRDYDSDVTEYDEIVVGSPVWNGRLTPAANSVLARTDLSGKTVSFILTAGGGTAPKAEERIAKEFPGSRVVILKEPKKYAEELSKLDP